MFISYKSHIKTQAEVEILQILSMPVAIGFMYA